MIVKGVIFDFDGTLADTLPLCIRAFRSSIEPRLGRSVSDAEIIATFGPSEEGTIKALIPDAFDEGVAAYLTHYEQFHADYPDLFPGVQSLLTHLQSKDVKLALVTGKGRHSAAMSLKFYQLTSYFSAFGYGDLQVNSKTGNINRIREEWQLAPEEVLYVGDAPSDITACRQAGVPIAAAAWASTAVPAMLEPLKPDALFHSVDSFRTWLFDRLP
ncbi:HAD hydrolase-like protein [Spirosoma sp. RP8]|uniref:phosphoglycolate phosphatase n=1 Tax=Spirosoma liriopis TaxID=2937440 RepID=A0ABT0HNF4_9BACT|nr:HAD hydrolase-like protein [Spirosoma liriopis]MCK8493701.1 HAD hydrolase-like protein [Spirosoma liriopis]